MTKEELAKVPFQCIASLAMEHEHCLTYVNEQYGFGMCRHTKVKEGGMDFGRTYTHYRLGDKVFKSLPGFLEAIKDIPYVELKEEDSECMVIDFGTRKRIE